jgi:hypothetical protein
VTMHFVVSFRSLRCIPFIVICRVGWLLQIEIRTLGCEQVGTMVKWAPENIAFNRDCCRHADIPDLTYDYNSKGVFIDH